MRLAELTTLRLGGPARALVEAGTQAALVDAVRAADAAGEPVLVVGGGSNLVVADRGFDGTAVLVRTRGTERTRGPDGRLELTVQAGEQWDDLVAATVDDGSGDLAALSGIPGLAGATPIQNVGAYGQEIARVVTRVRVLDRRTGAVVDLAAAECGFGYRTSRFKQEPALVVLEVGLSLDVADAPVGYPELARTLGVQVGESAPPAQVRAAVLALRRGKGMVVEPGSGQDLDTRSAGSFFTNPVLPADAAPVASLPADAPRFPAGDGTGGLVKLSAAWLIERAGFTKGYGHGDARISSKHTLALTNRGAATTDQLLDLAAEIVAGVRDRFGIVLVPEPVLVGCELPAR